VFIHGHRANEFLDGDIAGNEARVAIVGKRTRLTATVTPRVIDSRWLETRRERGAERGRLRLQDIKKGESA